MEQRRKSQKTCGIRRNDQLASENDEKIDGQLTAAALSMRFDDINLPISGPSELPDPELTPESLLPLNRENEYAKHVIISNGLRLLPPLGRPKIVSICNGNWNYLELNSSQVKGGQLNQKWKPFTLINRKKQHSFQYQIIQLTRYRFFGRGQRFAPLVQLADAADVGGGAIGRRLASDPRQTAKGHVDQRFPASCNTRRLPRTCGATCGSPPQTREHFSSWHCQNSHQNFTKIDSNGNEFVQWPLKSSKFGVAKSPIWLHLTKIHRK